LDRLAEKHVNANPLYGPNRFKLGLFNVNCNGGLTISLAPERWAADWDDVVAATLMADRAGFDFILPVAKWHGYGGKSNYLGRSFETLTHGAALGALTRYTAMFSTVHVPLVTPAFAAKAIATIDHVTHGRAGLNIVCGWNSDEFNMHGIAIDAERRYDQGLEWFKVWAKTLEGGPKFDWDGEFYKLKGVFTDPVTIQRPRPPVMSAGFSRKGRDFAAQAADCLFTIISEVDQVPGMVRDVTDYAARYGRNVRATPRRKWSAVPRAKRQRITITISLRRWRTMRLWSTTGDRFGRAAAATRRSLSGLIRTSIHAPPARPTLAPTRVSIR